VQRPIIRARPFRTASMPSSIMVSLAEASRVQSLCPLVADTAVKRPQFPDVVSQRGRFSRWTNTSADISPVGEAPSWLPTNREFESRGGCSREWFAAGSLNSVWVVDTLLANNTLLLPEHALCGLDPCPEFYYGTPRRGLCLCSEPTPTRG